MRSPSFDEVRACTDPLRNGSVFRLAAVERTPEGGITVRWPGAAGRTYSVYRPQELGSGNYLLLAAGIPAEAPTAEFTDSAPPQGHAFYWVEVE